jgi:hypothetical protein
MAISPGAAFARAPYAVDDAGITDMGRIQSADWFSHSDKGENLAVLGVAFTPVKSLETTFQAGRDAGQGNNVTQLTLQEKYLWHAAGADQWASSLVGGVNYNTIAGKTSGAYAYVPVTFTVTKDINFSIDGGWQYDRGADRNYATWGTNATYQATSAIGFAAEFFGRNTGRAGEQAGINWQTASQSLTVDVIYGHNIDGNSSEWGTLGLTFLY